MCQRCVNNLIDLLPNDMPWDKRMDVLWNFTAFPAGSADTVEKQLKAYMETRQVTSQQKPSVGRETKHRHPITGE